MGATPQERQVKIKTDSSSWGNYNNATFDITRGKYSTNIGRIFNPVSKIYTKPYSKVLLTTGATDRNKTLNIYDLAGNDWEWTLEHSDSKEEPCTLRSGGYLYDGSKYPAIIQFKTSPTDPDGTFRTTLF